MAGRILRQGDVEDQVDRKNPLKQEYEHIYTTVKFELWPGLISGVELSPVYFL